MGDSTMHLALQRANGCCGLQGRLSDIQASLQAIGAASTAGTEEMREAVAQSLNSLQQAQADFIASHREVSTVSQTRMEFSVSAWPESCLSGCALQENTSTKLCCCRPIRW